MRVALIRTEYVIPVPKSLPSSLGVATIKHQKHHIHTYRQVRVEVTARGSWGTWEEPTVVNSVAHCLQHNVRHPLETKLGNFHPPVFLHHLRLLELNLLKITTLLHVIIITLGEHERTWAVEGLTLCGYLSLQTMKVAIRLNGFLKGEKNHLKIHTHTHKKMFA